MNTLKGVLFFSQFHEPALLTKIAVIIYKINDFLKILALI